MEVPAQEMNVIKNKQKKHAENHRQEKSEGNSDQLTLKKDIPSPSASRGLLFFSHVIFAAGFASAATHVASCGTKKVSLKFHIFRLNLYFKLFKHPNI